MKVGNKLKQIRIYFHMTQKELSEGICSQAFLSKIENNIEIPNAEILFNLCKKIGVSVEQLFGESIDTIQQKLIYRKMIEDLIREQNYNAALKLLQKRYLLHGYSDDHNYQIHHYYLGICNYHLNNNIAEAERNFNLAYKQENSISNLSINPLNILITNALAIIKIHNKDFECGRRLLETCYSQISQLSSNLHSEMHSKIFYNLSKCYYLEGGYESSLKISKEGIEWTKRFSTTHFLAQLHYQKGVAELKLSQLNFAKQSLVLALSVAKVHNNQFLYEKIMESDLCKTFYHEIESLFYILKF
ncbi:helix-turn-helix domain-containing protein [Bacillus cereus]|uniref:helix-turn-helix domain-containing protein n=1 Tax=Bacillus cereus TaxID=1396 RepID=UPI0018F409DC|nr:helix-turn-helix domain-containing protein [Bacillus cereus]MBJ8154291.1 helix-turn-helix transcriptional regulator [Bacillus cereus]